MALLDIVIYILLLGHTVLSNESSSSSTGPLHQLYIDKITGYIKQLPPKVGLQPVDVNVALNLLYIEDMDTTTGRGKVISGIWDFKK